MVRNAASLRLHADLPSQPALRRWRNVKRYRPCPLYDWQALGWL